MAEYWDLYDNERKALGRTHLRGRPLPENTYHVVVSVWTVNQDNKLLLTLRSEEKELYPNLWENTSGSVVSGETSAQAALRELEEETGIVATEDELVFLGTARKVFSFVDIYLVRKTMKDSAIRLQQGETTAYRWVTLPELEHIHRQGKLAFPVAYRFEQFRTLFESMLSPNT
ncbi:NUDIX domain-containing protein [Sphaerochaeta associata]|uniref:NUDIX domain-containing protein n=1 Tax=Sphaerochaeta associata TaxID=1129264 RepID=A0ABY4D9W0_9SPIR|nr:NUDIX domain-containing protein [Sphaerochaeta associata]UOM50790.1 NUDIX domain-containing protein [Sphaerochaeta associata]SMP38859.1 NUDIX domain-containing protein [Sphaerochaeta associata]